MGEDTSLRNFESFGGRIVDLESEIKESVAVELEFKIFNDFTFLLDVVVIIPGVFESKLDVRTAKLFCCNLVLCFTLNGN